MARFKTILFGFILFLFLPLMLFSLLKFGFTNGDNSSISFNAFLEYTETYDSDHFYHVIDSLNEYSKIFDNVKDSNFFTLVLNVVIAIYSCIFNTVKLLVQIVQLLLYSVTWILGLFPWMFTH